MNGRWMFMMESYMWFWGMAMVFNRNASGCGGFESGRMVGEWVFERRVLWEEGWFMYGLQRVVGTDFEKLLVI